MKNLILILSLVTLGDAQAFLESTAYERTVSAIESNQRECKDSSPSEAKYSWSTSKFKSRHDFNKNPYYVRYSQFGCLKGEKGSAVIAPGRTESSLKYLETAYDLIAKGYSPIFAIDHRGQGFSPRFLENTQKGHVEKFSNYVDDFEDFMNQIVLGKTSVADRKNLFLLSNSMGGAISTRYFQRLGESSPIRAAILFGPMIKINFKKDNPEDSRTESGVRLQASLLCLSGLRLAGLECNSYADPTWTDYNPQARALDPNNPKPGNLTHSLARFEARNYLWDTKWSTRADGDYQAFEKWEGLPLGGPSVRWIWQATKVNQHMRSLREVRKIKTPMVIVTGDQDIRADLASHGEFCQSVSEQGGKCEMHYLKNAFHELMVESDLYRDQAMDLMFKHFQKYSR